MGRKSFVGRERGRPFVARDGALVFELFRENELKPKKISIASGTLKPGQKAIPHYHNCSTEIYFVLFGRGRVQVGNKVEIIKADDAVYVPVGKKHALENTSNREPLKVLAICSPPYSDDDTFFLE